MRKVGIAFSVAASLMTYAARAQDTSRRVGSPPAIGEYVVRSSVDSFRMCSVPASTPIDKLKNIDVKCEVIPDHYDITLTVDPDVPDQYRVVNHRHHEITFGYVSKEYFFRVIIPSPSKGVPAQTKRIHYAPGDKIKITSASGKLFPYLLPVPPSKVSTVSYGTVTTVSKDAIDLKNYLVEVDWCGQLICEIGTKLPGYGDIWGLFFPKGLSLSKNREGTYGEITGDNPKILDLQQ